MRISEKVDNILETRRDEKEIQRWIFSLIPLGVAFVFFFIFLLPMDIPNKDTVLITGAAAGFAGLQAYWISRGWQRGDRSTILLGVVGLVAVAIFVWAYGNFLGEILREVARGWVR